MKNMLTFFVVLVSATFSFGQSVYEIPYVSPADAPVLGDSVDSVWLTADPAEIALSHGGAEADDADDFLAEFRLLYNEESLFVLWQIIDDEWVTDDAGDFDPEVDFSQQSWYKDDACTLILPAAPWEYPVYEIAWVPFNTHEQKARFPGTSFNEDGTNDSSFIDVEYMHCEWFERDDEYGYIAEARIDWEGLDFDLDIEDGDEFPFDIRARDDDDGDGWDHKYTWNMANSHKLIDNMGIAETLPGTVSKVNRQGQNPAYYGLEQNYPNPFNPGTTIGYRLEGAADVTLAVYDVMGRHIRTIVRANQHAGVFEADWDGRDANGRAVAGGVYFYELRTEGRNGTFETMKKMTLVR